MVNSDITEPSYLAQKPDYILLQERYSIWACLKVYVSCLNLMLYGAIKFRDSQMKYAILQNCGLYLIGAITTPYYKKRNLESLFNRPKLLLSFPHPQDGRSSIASTTRSCGLTSELKKGLRKIPQPLYSLREMISQNKAYAFKKIRVSFCQLVWGRLP